MSGEEDFGGGISAELRTHFYLTKTRRGLHQLATFASFKFKVLPCLSECLHVVQSLPDSFSASMSMSTGEYGHAFHPGSAADTRPGPHCHGVTNRFVACLS